VLLLPSGSSRPTGVTKLLRDDMLLSLLSKDKRCLLLCKFEVGVCTRGNGYSDSTVLFLPLRKNSRLNGNSSCT
jgi:hypothetical protein